MLVLPAKSWQWRTISFADRVYLRVNKDADTGCHNFTGQLNTDGYGQIKDRGRSVMVHRWVWEQSNGPIPAGLCVCHHCDNPRCINPAHLYAGTHQRNMQDKADRGRSNNVPRGHAHKRPRAKVTEKQVIAIKVALAAKKSQISQAVRFGVSRNLISEIYLEKTWRHLNIHVCNYGN